MLDDPLVQDLLRKIIDDPEDHQEAKKSKSKKSKKNDDKDLDNMLIVQCLNKGVKTDEEIAEKTGIRLNIVRKILYRLYDAGLASYKRHKDPETQWYSYDWKFEPEEVNKTIKKQINDEIEFLKNILDNEKDNMFFSCPEGHTRFDFEDASNVGFTCPECGEEVVFEDNADIIKELEKDIKKYQKIYDSIEVNE